MFNILMVRIVRTVRGLHLSSDIRQGKVSQNLNKHFVFTFALDPHFNFYHRHLILSGGSIQTGSKKKVKVQVKNISIHTLDINSITNS